jgi:hypothetical protein
MIRNKVEQDFSGFDVIRRRMDNAIKYHVEVGYDQEMHPEHDISMADLAFLHEVGGEGLPVRDFLNQTAVTFSHSGDARKELPKVIGKYILTGEEVAYRTGLEKIGYGMSETIKFIIEAGGDFVPNSAQTLAGKAPETRPLVETGYTMNNAKVWVERGDSD